ncbi:MAG: protein-disulfide reductase DsbD [Betaproteobacteria bacterium]|nr:protein-disulfide reductase DsbD [Betaproteobacteria bacterium]
MRFCLTILLFAAASLAAIGVRADPLPPNVAFRFSATPVDSHDIAVRYVIAPGYYLYRSKFRFSVKGQGRLQAARYPAGTIKQDPFFGREEIYRNGVRIVLPIADAAGPLTLTAVAQGCADIGQGVCYPPMTHVVTLRLPAPPTVAQSASVAWLAPRPPGADAAAGFLPPNAAFGLTVQAASPNDVIARFSPASHYYLYRDRIHFSTSDPGVSIAKVAFPPAEFEDLPSFGKVAIYRGPFQANIALHRRASAGTVVLNAVYQGCSERGVCYPPIHRTFNIRLEGPPSAVPATFAAPVPQSGGATPSQPLGIDHLLKGGHYWLALGFFFGAGLLLSFTPCVFPMIPILSGIIVGQGSHINKRRGFILSGAYVLGVALTYAGAGVAAGLSGNLISNALQNPWALGTFALIFVLLAFSMFGFYELQLPNFLQSRLSDASNRLKGGNLAGVFVMGMLSALIIGPCVAAPLAGALLYIGQTHDVWLGGSALFTMALGMGVPLMAVGVSAGALLPRAGGWMNAVKGFFGILLLGVAIWIVTPVVPAIASMVAWAMLLIISAMYLKAIDPLPPHAKGAARFWKGVGLIALIAGVSILIGALSGSRDPLQPLTGLRASRAQPGRARAPADLTFTPITGPADLARVLKSAAGRNVMLDFYADWCVSCKELDAETFADPRVREALGHVKLLRVDVTDNTPNERALLAQFGLYGPPGIVFFGKHGKPLASPVVGFTSPDQFLRILAHTVG